MLLILLFIGENSKKFEEQINVAESKSVLQAKYYSGDLKILKTKY